MEEKKLSSLNIDETYYDSLLTRKYMERKKYVPANPKQMCSHIPGVIREIAVHSGQSVKKGDHLLTLEAMKMMNNLTSGTDGKIKKIFVSEGEMVTKGHPLIEFE